jgi:putative redox protein
LLVLHSPADEVVGIDDASRIYQAALHPKSFISLDRADHLLSDQRDSTYAGSMIATWAEKYLQSDGMPTRSDTLDAVDDGTDEWVVVEIGKGYTTRVRAGAHRLLADEPVDLGGGDRGPAPYDLLLAALGACTAITLRMYADRKGWPLESGSIRLNHGKIHAEDCAECETREGRVDRIEQQIDLRGGLDADQHKRLMEIASVVRCTGRSTQKCIFIPSQRPEAGESTGRRQRSALPRTSGIVGMPRGGLP